MDINEEIVKFVISARNKLAEYGQRIEQLIRDGEERSKEYEEIMDNTELLDWIIDAVYAVNYDIVDSDMNQVYNFINKPDDEVYKMLSDWRYLFGLDIYPYSDISLSSSTFLQSIEEVGTGGAGLPSGGVLGYVLTIGPDGNAYWAEPTVYFEVVNY